MAAPEAEVGRGPVWVASEADVAALAARVRDSTRDIPVVCLTTQPYLQRPMLDPDSVDRALDGQAEVWVITRTQHAWSLTAALPAGLDVYGGAARVWWPIADPAAPNPDEHPVFTIFSPHDAPRVTSEVAAHVRRRLSPPPEPGLETMAVVTAVLEQGAELTLASGHEAFVANAHLAHGEIFHAREAVREGQHVRVRIAGPPPPGRQRYHVSLLPFAPQPWQRLAAVYRPGMVVEGVVVALRSFGALVELIPGASGLVPNRLISRTFVAHPEDHLGVDDRVIVRINSLDPVERRAELSLIDVPASATVEPPASVYPDGPAWLLPIATEDEPDEPGAPDEPRAPDEPDDGPVAADPALRAGETPAAERGLLPEGEPTAAELVEPPEPEPLFDADGSIDATPPAEAPSAAAQELVELREAIAAASGAREQLSIVTEDTERELAQLRAHARTFTAELRQEIADLELRALRLAEQDGRAIAEQASQDVRLLEQRVTDLRERLRAAERDREELIRQTSGLTDRLTEKSRQLDTSRGRAAEIEREAARLREELDVVDGGDRGLRFLRELNFTWRRVYANDADRERWPLVQAILGPAFLDSLQATEGVSRPRVLEVCAHVVTGRAAEISGLELHQLRTSDAGNAPMRVRDDGATAWRVSLQVNTPAARRLHYWLLPDGRIELSKIGVHDDLAIA